MDDELEQRAADYVSSVLGFNGERIDPVLGGYHLGNGYRLYNPALRRFTSPDNMSPFGAGGINPYAYCEGDPINNTDPTGHFGIFGALINAGMLAADLLTDGMASVAEEGVIVATEGESIAARKAAKVGSKAIRGGEEAANIAKYGKPYPSQGELGHANFKLFRPDTETMEDRERAKGLKSLTHLMNNVGGYTENFNGTGEPGLVAHGNTGKLRIVDGSKAVKGLDKLDALQYLDSEYKLNLFQQTDTPLHIFACGTSSPDLGIKLADALGRPIVLYGTDNEVVASNAKSLLSGMRTEILGRGDGSVTLLNDLAEAVKTTYFPSYYRYIG
ncbi:RHS repeat-associated core domain-containing protein [Pseudomonas sp. PDM25]|uniref:RHS repeat-associated core domain-containing protein n=1 Tax=Pseudomonas sp. PDM25 TaxID=2854772 RepID=UPI0021106F8C|nr:RHS repeat-associated core domain-containing protein [Pseudomonas sp. PDM25]